MGNIWGVHHLTPHVETPPGRVETVTAQLLGFRDQLLFVEWAISPRESVLFPAPSEPVRTDGLWQTTCFEVFLRSAASDAYFEFNFSPSFAWAAYAFEGYRQGMRPVPLPSDPEILRSPSASEGWFFQSAEFDVPESLAAPVLASFTAVIEETDGRKSYWALAHPPGKPDFHHPDCFVLELPPPSAS